ncbi:polysaccharide biosynthesis/export family protein [Sulfurovum sp.]|uniref:polysaccharide biosynthesis/export family protein n=1 Tax=Sulfurovum sp. TaxID=1969726 RepID=UPI0025FF4297|nr:polysaccharide biosynthesis/export family protein [Sulfurovum sp.]
MKKAGVLLILMGLLLSGCGSLTSEYQLLQTPTKSKEVVVTDRSIEYRILPQDRLEIMLYKDPSAAAESVSSGLGQSLNPAGILVDVAGNVRLPLIGKVHVAGLTQTQAADKITKLYRKYLNTPSVYLEVLNKRLLVLGEVKNPGVVKIDKEKMTLFEALAFSGGLTDSAVRDNIIIVSPRPTGMVMRTIDLTHFNKMRYADLMLRPNDIVYVQPDGWKEYRIKSSNFTAPLETITKVAAPFVTLKYLFN